MTTVYVVDDHGLLRQGIVTILERGGIQVAGEADSVVNLKRLLSTKSPDAVILDISMPEGSGLEAIKELKELYPKIPILILSMYPEDQYAVRSIKLGAAGYLSKQGAPELLVKAIKTVVKGERFLTERVADLIAGELQHRDSTKALHETLSERELEVLMAIAQGQALSTVAKNSHLSVKTISTYRARVLKKLGVRSNADVIHYAIEHKLLPK